MPFIPLDCDSLRTGTDYGTAAVFSTSELVPGSTRQVKRVRHLVKEKEESLVSALLHSMGIGACSKPF